MNELSSLSELTPEEIRWYNEESHQYNLWNANATAFIEYASRFIVGARASQAGERRRVWARNRRQRAIAIIQTQIDLVIELQLSNALNALDRWRPLFHWNTLSREQFRSAESYCVQSFERVERHFERLPQLSVPRHQAEEITLNRLEQIAGFLIDQFESLSRFSALEARHHLELNTFRHLYDDWNTYADSLIRYCIDYFGERRALSLWFVVELRGMRESNRSHSPDYGAIVPVELPTYFVFTPPVAPRLDVLMSSQLFGKDRKKGQIFETLQIK